MKKTKKGRIGSSFDDFLKNEGVYEEVSARDQARDCAATRCADAGSGFD